MKNTVPLKKNSEFLRLYKKGKFFAGKNIVLYVMKNDLGINRLGITVGKNSVKALKGTGWKDLSEKITGSMKSL